MPRSSLRRERSLPVIPPPANPTNPAVMVPTHVDITVSRDPSRKAITLDVYPIEIRDGIRSVLLGHGWNWSARLGASPTHAPKRFVAVADPLMAQFEQRTGLYFDAVVAHLASHGLTRAPA